MNYRTCPHCGANLDHGEICDCRKAINLGGEIYPIAEEVKTTGGSLPLAELPMGSDYQWQRKALEDRIRHPERYIALDADPEATICRLIRWLAENEPEVV